MRFYEDEITEKVASKELSHQSQDRFSDLLFTGISSLRLYQSHRPFKNKAFRAIKEPNTFALIFIPFH